MIIDLCTNDLKEHLVLNTREMTYKQVRDEIISYAERKRNAFSNDLKAMDLDEVEDDHVWWGGMEHDHEQWDLHCPKGSHNDFKGVSKGDNSKGGSKGDSQGKGGTPGIATGAESGATLNRVVVRRTTTWRTSGRTGRATLRGGYEQIAHIMEENKNQLENLEKSGGYRCSCSLEHRGCVTSNWFAALKESIEDEEMSVGTGTPPELFRFIGLRNFEPEHNRLERLIRKSADFGVQHTANNFK